jgi:hypothetical protein
MAIDNNIVEQARNADMIAFLERYCGFTFDRKGSEYRCKQHPSLAVKDDRRTWYWHSKGIGGCGAIDFLMKINNLLFPQAVAAATPFIGMAAPPPKSAGPDKPKTLYLPEKRGIPLRLYDYLCVRRGIDSGVVHMLIQEEKIYEDRRGNVVFVGHDGRNQPRFASVRGTQANRGFRMDCPGSDKRYGFSMAAIEPSKRLYVFESPIDAMSHASLAILEFGDREAWLFDNRLSLGGTGDAAMPFFLNQQESVEEIVLCLDNDSPGRVAANALQRKYADKGYTAWIQQPQGKDFNDDLLALLKQRQAERARLHRAAGDRTI